jgi:hypothetical protein
MPCARLSKSSIERPVRSEVALRPTQARLSPPLIPSRTGRPRENLGAPPVDHLRAGASRFTFVIVVAVRQTQ